MPPRAFDTSGPFARGLSGVKEDRRFESNPGAPSTNKSRREWAIRWQDGFSRTVKCAFCPDWDGVTGDGPTTREALAEHRLERHYQ